MAANQRRLKVGVVGAGFAHSPDGRERWAVRAHLPALKALPELYEVAAVCTTRMATAEETARHFGVPHAFDSVERMVARLPELDVVCVSVRPVYHHQVAMVALQAGKHVYCEHPMGFTTQQAREMYNLARTKGVRTIVGHQSHYLPASLHMGELVRQGFIGRPLAFGYSYCASNYITPRPSHRQWLFQSEMGGHPGYRSGHSLEHLMAVVGRDVTAICADMAIQVPERRALDTGGVIRSNQVDNMNYLLRMSDGVMGAMQICWTAWFGTADRFEMYGTEGMLLLVTDQSPQGWSKESGQGDPTRGELRLYGARVEMERLLAEPTPPERLQRMFQEVPVPERHTYVSGIERGRATFAVAQAWAAFARAIHEGRECAPSFRDVLKIHCILDAAEESARRKAWVDVDYSGL
ncbi:MAG: Gfo/Idh/MocA family oxidoreductase [Chloroflexi bacterium]|nr:Gfo/Idh/MocA family oxidoreductase [Chloroflexota bacterium]